MDFWHVTFASDGRMPLFDSEATRRDAVGALVRVAQPHLALHSIVDDHAHVVTGGTRTEVGHRSRAVRLALAHRTTCSIDAGRIRPVESRSHAQWLANQYIVGQLDHHGLPDHPALYSGSCFSDIVGARRIGEVNVLELLPRFRIRDVLAAVGLPVEPIEPIEIEAIRTLGIGRLVGAAAFAIGRVDLDGKTEDVVRARQAVAQLADTAGIARSEVSHALEVTARGVLKMITAEAPKVLSRAVRLRLAIEEKVRNQGRSSKP